MKYIRQIIIILFIAFLGEILNHLIPLPVPASIYGIIIMFAALVSGILKTESVKETSVPFVKRYAAFAVPSVVESVPAVTVNVPVTSETVPLVVVKDALLLFAVTFTPSAKV